MIQKKHFHILDAVSVLLFAILANFIFSLKIDFRQVISWITIIKLIALSFSAFPFYFAIYKLRNLYEEAENDDRNETDLVIKANNPIIKRYELKYDKEKKKVYLLIGLSVLSVLLFFLLEPAVYAIKDMAMN